jgi:hypothetical protein
LLIIFLYGFQFDYYKIYLIGIVLYIFSVLYTHKINIRLFYILYFFTLLFILYFMIGLFFILFFLLNDLLLYFKVDISSEIHVYLLLFFILWIYVYCSIYLSKLLTFKFSAKGGKTGDKE